jgi:hypothetical protein
MALSLFDITTAFSQTVGAMAGVMERGLAHCVDNNIDPQTIVDSRLHPDMLPFAFQIASVAHHSIGAIEGVKAGLFSPSTDFALDYAGLQKKIAGARDALAKLTAAEVNALEGKDVLFQMRDFKMPFTAEGFLLSFSLPNLHFHATTAYDILRHKGVPLGKRDYLGQLRLKG